MLEKLEHSDLYICFYHQNFKFLISSDIGYLYSNGIIFHCNKNKKFHITALTMKFYIFTFELSLVFAWIFFFSTLGRNELKILEKENS